MPRPAPLLASLLCLAGLSLLPAALAPAEAHLAPTDSELARSRSVLGDFATGTEVFSLSLHLERAIALPVDVLVPPQQPLREHRPALALLGPGLPTLSDADAAALPGPASAGGFIQWNQEPERPFVFERSTRRAFWASPTVALPLAAGDYELRVWSPQGSAGEFAVGLGVDDDPLRAEVLRVGELTLMDPR